MGAYEHKPLRIICIVLAVVMFAITGSFNGLSAAGPAASGGIFLNATNEISDRYNVEITPAGWTFSIWGFIYAWQALWVVYGITTIFREGIGGYLYYSPDIMPIGVYLFYALNMAANLTWLFMWDRVYLIASPIVAGIMAFTLYVSLFFSFRAVYEHLPVMQKNNKMADVWLIRMLVQNGIAFYATWVTFATLLNMAISITYTLDFPQNDACTITLSILSAIIIAWFVMETFIFDKYIRYTFSPYIVLIIALAGSLDKNYEDGNRNSIFSVVLVGLAGLLFVVKMLVIFIRHIKNPITIMAISEGEYPVSESKMSTLEKY